MADTARVHPRNRLRRAAETCVILGLCLMAAAAVASAQDPTPAPVEPQPVETATPVGTATPEPLATVIATPPPALAPEPVLPAEPTATATPALTAEPTVTPFATAPPVVAERPEPTRRPRQGATPTPTPAPTAPPDKPDQFQGAALTLCHFTGDATLPYVAVTVDANRFSPHYDHPRDIIPAPSAGCASITDPEAAAAEDVLVCHRLGPGRYELLGPFEPDALDEHDLHRGDLIPAPNGTCPGLDPYAVPTVTATPEPEPEPTATATATTEPVPFEPNGECDDVPEPEGEASAAACAAPTAEPEADDVDGGDVAGVDFGSPTTAAEQLPFTGLDLWLIAASGLGLALMGAGMRLLTAQPAVGVTR